MILPDMSIKEAGKEKVPSPFTSNHGMLMSMSSWS